MNGFLLVKLVLCAAVGFCSLLDRCLRKLFVVAVGGCRFCSLLIVAGGDCCCLRMLFIAELLLEEIAAV